MHDASWLQKSSIWGKKKNECRIDGMRQPYHIKYKHYRGWNKIKIYSSVTNVPNGCYLLWLSSPFENWFRDPDSFHLGSGPSLIYDFQDPGDYLHEDGGREKNLGDYAWELCMNQGWEWNLSLALTFHCWNSFTMSESKLSNFIKAHAHKEKESGLVQSWALPWPTKLVCSPASMILSTHRHMQDCFPASFWLDGSLSGHTKGSCPKETPRSTLDSLCARF